MTDDNGGDRSSIDVVQRSTQQSCVYDDDDENDIGLVNVKEEEGKGRSCISRYGGDPVPKSLGWFSEESSPPPTPMLVSATGVTHSSAPLLWLVCDLGGYGLPKEVRPRQEKIYAICRQLVNFLTWQQQKKSSLELMFPQKDDDGRFKNEGVPNIKQDYVAARLIIVLGPNESTTTFSQTGDTFDSLRQLLLERMQTVWNQQQQQHSINYASTVADGAPFPEHRVLFSSDSLLVTLETLQHQQAKDSTEYSVSTTPLPTATSTGIILTEGSANVKDESTHDNNDKNAAQPTTTVPAGSAATTTTTTTAVYLSPDAEEALNPHDPPPSIVIVGLLIDRRTIQVNRSVRRASALGISLARWPMEHILLPTLLQPVVRDKEQQPTQEQQNGTPNSINECETKMAMLRLHKNEPLNVDCVLEGMQQWHWNYYYQYGNSVMMQRPDSASAFVEAATQAIRHHQQRHPERTRHKDL